VAPQLPAAPTITSVANAASNIWFNSPIARGAIFVIKGTGLGPETLSIAPAPFKTTSLSGTKVTVTAGTITEDAPIYYTSATQIAALLPSKIPAGGANFTVTYNGQTSNSVGHGTAENNLGVFTIDSSGQGPGIVTYPDYSLVSASKPSNCGGPNTACGAANPGDTLILWGTGLGPVSGDETGGAGLGEAMPNVSLKLWLGGVQVPVVYQGRSGCCVGEDQIVFTVPNNVPTGCAVPLVVQIGEVTNTISNTTVMPVATGSRNCTPTNPALANVQTAVGGPVSIGSIELDKEPNDKGTGYQDRAVFEFFKLPTPPVPVQPFFVSWIDDPPPGTCTVYSNLNGAGDPPINGDPVLLGAGSNFTVAGPAGSLPVTLSSGKTSATLSDAGTFLVPGSYTITGAGGADVGSFTAAITFPAAPTLVSPVNNAAVTRSSGMTVTWTGGAPNGNVKISIASSIDNTYKNGSLAVCKAPAGPGTFTIPPYVLLALPGTNFGGFLLAPETTNAVFAATGLSLGLVQTFHNGTGFGYGAATGGFALK
jgi:uncharacterized protein (TIGR03437 family)